MSNKAQIQHALLVAIDSKMSSPVAHVVAQSGLARQTVSKYLQELVKLGQVKICGKGKSTKYEIVEKRAEKHFSLTKELVEDLVWNQVATDLFDDLSDAERSIFQYGFTEMVNNAIEHSEGSNLAIVTIKSPIKLTMIVQDNGIGVFKKIAIALSLSDARQSLLELSKGKFTTDPEHHTGEGIFFTSRSFDHFSITANSLMLMHNDLPNKELSDNWLIETEARGSSGTIIVMTLVLPSARKLEEVFQKYSSGPEDYTFARTHVPLNLARYGRDELVSRSQARRILSRIDRFAEVLLDFASVEHIGQAFADEIFRVFTLQHPDIKVQYINANNDVERMIKRAVANRSIEKA